MTSVQKKIKKTESKIDKLEKQLWEDDINLRIEIDRYDRNLPNDTFDSEPSREGKTALQIRLEKDFYERSQNLKKLKTKLSQLRQFLEQQQKNTYSDGILVEQGKIHEAVDAAERLLSEKDLGIYQRAGRLVRLTVAQSLPQKAVARIKDEGKELIISAEGVKKNLESLLIAEVDTAYLLEQLTRHAHWLKFDLRANNLKPIDCPEKVAKLLLARKQWNLPILMGVIQAPTLFCDGTVLEKPGYDANSGLYLYTRGSFPFIPQHPSLEDAQAQAQTIKNLLAGFPFDGEESFCVALSAMMTALVRKSIATAPLHGFTAPKMGTGKSLLADVVSLIATGKPNSVIPQADNESEERKRLMAVLLDGDPIICFDNIERPFGSATLCSVLTQQQLKDRILGETRNMAVSTRATFLATGNNLTFIGDLSSRAILCKLDPKMERPEERSFDINLHQYLAEHREEVA